VIVLFLIKLTNRLPIIRLNKNEKSYFFFLATTDEHATTEPRVIEDEEDGVLRPQRYARKWRRLAKVNQN